MRSTQITYAMPPLVKAARVSSVGQTISGNGVVALRCHEIAQPSYSASLLYPVGLAEAEVFVDIGANVISVVMHGVEPLRRKLDDCIAELEDHRLQDRDNGLQMTEVVPIAIA